VRDGELLIGHARFFDHNGQKTNHPQVPEPLCAIKGVEYMREIA
jgi:hypothetical protein